MIMDRFDVFSAVCGQFNYDVLSAIGPEQIRPT